MAHSTPSTVSNSLLNSRCIFSGQLVGKKSKLMNKNANDGWQIPQKNTVLQHLPLNVAVELNLNLILKTNRMLTSLCTV